MKRDNSTFVQLPQKTSLHIDSQVNNLKNIMQINCMMKHKNAFVPFSLKGQYVGCTLIRLKRKEFSYNLSKTF